MLKRLLLLLVLIAAVVVATGCCEWAKRNCSASQPLPGPVIRLGLQSGSGVWTVDGVAQQVASQSTATIRQDFIGIGTRTLKCTVNGIEVDVSWIRLTMDGYAVVISKPTSGTPNSPHWLVEGRGGRTYELLPADNPPSGQVPLELASPTAIETTVDGTSRQCSGLKLQVWLK